MDIETFSNQVPLEPEFKAVFEELLSMGKILNLDTQQKVLQATGAITNNDEFTVNTFSELLQKRIIKQIEEFGRVKASMFICPKLDLTNMQDTSRFFPSKLSISSIGGQQADIFISRIPRIFQMFENLVKTDSPH
jgi:hypothetical protein